jgi:hypothetical protein
MSIICIPWLDGGLGNRLRPLLSMLSIMKNSPHTITLNIVWRFNCTCNIHLNMLFDLCSIDESLIEPKEYTYLVKPYNINQILSVGLPIHTSYPVESFDKLLDNNVNHIINTPYWLTSKYVNVKQFPEIFCSILYEDTKTLCLDLKRRYNIGKHIFGCHLRATDLNNPIKMRSIMRNIRNQPNQSFFVCSDNKEIEEECKHLGNVILIENKSYVKRNDEHIIKWNRNCLRDEKSVKDALVDLCILSMCDIDNNDYHTIPESTFLDIARSIRGWEIYI